MIAARPGRGRGRARIAALAAAAVLAPGDRGKLGADLGAGCCCGPALGMEVMQQRTPLGVTGPTESVPEDPGGPFCLSQGAPTSFLQGSP